MTNDQIRLHIPAIPYTITRDEYSHDAYTGKVQRFSPMMRSRGFEVFHYGVETSESGANKNFDLLTKEEWRNLRIETVKFVDPKLTHEEAVKKNDDPEMVISTLSNWSSPLTKEFNKRFKQKLSENYRSKKTDIVCIPLGRTYQDALNGLDVVKIENGIGYSGSYFDFRIFESYAWMSRTLGVENKQPQNYWFVVPNYYDTEEFKYSATPKPLKVGYLGRVTELKGCNIIREVAKRFPHVEFVMCGQGEPNKFLDPKVPNLKYKSPIHGSERSNFLGECVAFIHPVKYLEPFGGGTLEAQLCGTPVICSDWGAMTETIEPYKTGLHCHTLADYCYGIQMALDGKFNRKYIRERSASLYDMYKIAHKYEYVYRSILDIYDISKNGWYSPDAHIKCLVENKIENKPENNQRIYLFIPYFGELPNYFQLYLDSLEINKDLLSVFFITDIDLSSYQLPENLIHVKMNIDEIKNRITNVIYKTYGKHVSTEDVLKFTYKFVDFKIIYPIIFDDLIKEHNIQTNDFVGWGDCDLIYGKLSNFINFNENYGIVGGWHGHFTAILNNNSFKHLFRNIQNYLDLILDNSKYHGTDEIAYREPLKKYIADNKIKMCYINKYFCDIVPPCFYHLSRPNHKDYTNNFYDLYNPTKSISNLYFDKINQKLNVFYDNGETREAAYGHLQKRKMQLPFTSYDNGFYIKEHSFSLE
jgi:glycosyltransferase involved in cell wall biosynthesis